MPLSTLHFLKLCSFRNLRSSLTAADQTQQQTPFHRLAFHFFASVLRVSNSSGIARKSSAVHTRRVINNLPSTRFPYSLTTSGVNPLGETVWDFWLHSIVPIKAYTSKKSHLLQIFAISRAATASTICSCTSSIVMSPSISTTRSDSRAAISRYFCQTRW